MAEVRWHINGNGVAGRCRAQPGECPISPNAPHFETAADARAAYEESMEADAVAEVLKRVDKAMSPSETVERKAARKKPKQARRAGDTGVSHGGYSGHGAMGSQSAFEIAVHGRKIAPAHIPEPIYGHGYSGHGRP